MSRASSMPAMISIGCPSASRARSRNACLRCARRSALVPTTRTLSACMSRRRWPKRSRQARARAATSLSMRPFSATPAARRTISRRRSMMTSWPCEWRATTMWKLLLPKSTAARTSGMGRGARRTLERNSASRAVTGAGTRDAAGSGGEGRAAATGGGGVRITDHELRAIEPLAVVDLRAGEVLHAHRIHQQLHAQVLDAGIAVLDLLIELEAVLQPRAAATLHEHAQHELRVALATDQVPDLAGRGVGELERGGLQQCFGATHDLLGAQSRSRLRRGQSRTSHIPAALSGSARRPGLRLETHQFTHDLGAQGHFNDAVVDVALDPGGRPQNHALTGVDIALDRTLQHHVRHLHRPFDGAGGTHRQGRMRRSGGANATGDVAVQVQPALELDIPEHACRLADQRIDAGRPGFAGEHGCSDGALVCGLQGEVSTLHRNVCESGPTSRRPELTSTLSRSGLKLGGTLSSWS